jgi:hypothetical protein
LRNDAFGDVHGWDYTGNSDVKNLLTSGDLM